MASVYIHFPWCLAKCPYCDFVSYAAPREEIDHCGYAHAVIAELEARALAWGPPAGNVKTIFFGGGTPSLWSAAELGRVLARTKEIFACAPGVEVTVECNPTSLDEAKARALLDVGVNRLSIGTQSLREEQLKFLGRLHDPGGALAAIDGAKAAGVSRISTDLIFGLAGQPPEDLGLGCGAFGQVRRTRYRNAIDPRKYLAAATSVRSDLLGEGDGLSMSSEALTGEMLLRERIMLGLRLAGGFDLEASANELGVEAWPKEREQAARKLVEGGRLVRESGTVFIPKPAWLWTDDIAARLF
jgi:coproporphyrinogen III oxidase-like Fe-S oxidoreductase